MNIQQIKRNYWYPISVSIEIGLRKLRVKVDKLYKKIWVYIFVILILPYLFAAIYQMRHDYSFIHNHANLDAPFAPIYMEWRTDGHLGQEPPFRNKF